MVLGKSLIAHAIPTNDACGFAGCLTSSDMVLFTELAYSGSVNTSSGLPSNNYLLPQLTNYFPAGNPLRSCTTASLVSYTPDAQPALAKRAPAAVPEPVAIDTWVAAPGLMPTITFTATAEANRVDPSPPVASSAKDQPATADVSANAPVTTSAAPPASQSIQTSTETPIFPSPTTPQATDSQSAEATTATMGGSAHDTDSSLGSMSLTGTMAGTVGNDSSVQPSTWNFVCSSQGCTLASKNDATAASPDTSSDASQTASQSGSVKASLSHSLGSIFLVAILFAMA